MHTFPAWARAVVRGFLLLGLLSMLIAFGWSVKEKRSQQAQNEQAAAQALSGQTRGMPSADAGGRASGNQMPSQGAGQAEGQAGQQAGGMNADAFSPEQADVMATLMRRLQTNPNDTEALTDLAEIFMEAKEWSRADIFLSRAVLSRPSDKRARYLSGISLFSQSKYEKAAETFKDLLQLHDDGPSMYNLAVLYKYFLNKPEEAPALLQKAAVLPDLDENTKALIAEELAHE